MDTAARVVVYSDNEVCRTADRRDSW